jgi:hypothetical protein
MTAPYEPAEAGAEIVIKHIREHQNLSFRQALADMERKPRRYGKRARKAEAAAVPAKPEAASAPAPSPSAPHHADSHPSRYSKTRANTLGEGMVF